MHRPFRRSTTGSNRSEPRLPSGSRGRPYPKYQRRFEQQQEFDECIRRQDVRSAGYRENRLTPGATTGVTSTTKTPSERDGRLQRATGSIHVSRSSTGSTGSSDVAVNSVRCSQQFGTARRDGSRDRFVPGCVLDFRQTRGQLAKSGAQEGLRGRRFVTLRRPHIGSRYWTSSCSGCSSNALPPDSGCTMICGRDRNRRA